MSERLFRDLEAETYFPDPSFPLAVGLAIVGDRDIGAHAHDFVEAVFVSKGKGYHKMESNSSVTSYPIKSGDIFLIAPDCRHAYHNNQELEVFNILFLPSVFGADAQALCSLPGLLDFLIIEPLFRDEDKFSHKLHLNATQSRWMHDQLGSIEKELDKKRQGYQLYAKSLFIESLVKLGRYTVDQFEANDEEVNHGRHRVVEQAMSFIEKNYSEDLSLEDIATQVYLSPNYFSEVFKSHSGLSPWEYVTTLRLEEACELLRQTKRTMTDIALSVGFSDSSYFSKVFKERFQQTPSQYRKQEQQ